MNFPKRLAASTAALLIFTGAVQAQDYMELARQLHAEGYENQATIRVRGDKIHVEVSGSAGRTERVYSRDASTLFEEESVGADGTRIEREYDSSGRVREEEIVLADGRKVEREYDSAGNVVEEEFDDDDDRDDDDDDRDDDDDDRDDDDDDRDDDDDDRDDDRDDDDDD